jgi:hypothetical protein
MIFGVLAESFVGERRVALIPESVQRLVGPGTIGLVSRRRLLRRRENRICASLLRARLSINTVSSFFL